MRISRIAVVVAVVGALVAGGCGSSDKKQSSDAATTTTTAAPRTVVDATAYDARLSNFATALNSAGLIPALSGKGPFTIFAADNDAFAKLPAARLKALLSGKKDELSKMLNAHVVAGRIAEKGADARELKTVAGTTVTLVRSGDGFTLTGPNNTTVAVVGAPIVASNGLVYPVDGLLDAS